jgi:hypothetical protein
VGYLQNTALEAIRAKDAEERQKLEALLREMAGKQYAYDQSGNVIKLTNLDSFSLPKQALLPGVNCDVVPREEGRHSKADKCAAPGAPRSANEDQIDTRNRVRELEWIACQSCFPFF